MKSYVYLRKEDEGIINVFINHQILFQKPSCKNNSLDLNLFILAIPHHPQPAQIIHNAPNVTQTFPVHHNRTGQQSLKIPDF